MLEMWQQSPGSVGQSIQIKPDSPPKKNSLFNSMSLWCTDIGSSVSKTADNCAVCINCLEYGRHLKNQSAYFC